MTSIADWHSSESNKLTVDLNTVGFPQVNNNQIKILVHDNSCIELDICI